MRNSYEPKKWYKEIQQIVTIDGKMLKSNYQVTAVPHLKGYNMMQSEVHRNNIPKKLTFIGIWNKIMNDIEIGVLSKKSGIDDQGNLIMGHIKVIPNVNVGATDILLNKCPGCALDNVQDMNENNRGGYNCNIMVEANDCLIIGTQIPNLRHEITFNNNNLKILKQTNLLDIKDLNYNDFLFRNNWKRYETTIE
jgi:hypothetical protein